MPFSLLSFLGLTRAEHLQTVSARTESLKHQVAEFKIQLRTQRQEVERWKRKAEESATRLDKAARETARWKQKDAGHRKQLSDLTAKFRRLEDTERHVALARTHLLTMETKLDVVEGAINVLDRRTRSDTIADTSQPENASPPERSG